MPALRRLWSAITGLCIAIPFNEEVVGLDFPLEKQGSDKRAAVLALRPFSLKVLAKAAGGDGGSVFENGQDVVFRDHRRENTKAVGRVVGKQNEMVVLSPSSAQHDRAEETDPDSLFMHRLRHLRRVPHGAVALRDESGKTRIIHGAALRGTIVARVDGVPSLLDEGVKEAIIVKMRSLLAGGSVASSTGRDGSSSGQGDKAMR